MNNKKTDQKEKHALESSRIMIISVDQYIGWALIVVYHNEITFVTTPDMHLKSNTNK